VSEAGGKYAARLLFPVSSVCLPVGKEVEKGGREVPREGEAV